MKTIITSILIFFINPFTFGQENPWTKQTETNPWINQDSLITIVEVPDSNNLKIDSLVIIDYTEKGYNEKGSGNGFVMGFVSCGLFNVFGVLPSALTLAAPNSHQRLAKTNLTVENPIISDSQIKEYKKGIGRKRVLSTFIGCITGTIVNTAIIVTALSL